MAIIKKSSSNNNPIDIIEEYRYVCGNDDCDWEEMTCVKKENGEVCPLCSDSIFIDLATFEELENESKPSEDSDSLKDQ